MIIDSAFINISNINTKHKTTKAEGLLHINAINPTHHQYTNMQDIALIALVSGVFSGLISAFAAQLKNHNRLTWFFLGFLFPAIAPLVIIFFKSTRTEENTPPSPKTHVRCPDCKELVRKDANVCKHCGCKLVPEPVAIPAKKNEPQIKAMKTCSICQSTNEDSNTECWKCGADI